MLQLLQCTVHLFTSIVLFVDLLQMASPAENIVVIRKFAFRPADSWKGRPFGLIEVEFSLKRVADFYHSMGPTIPEPPKGLFDQISRRSMDVVGYRHVSQRGHVVFIPLPDACSRFLESGDNVRERHNAWEVDLGCRAWATRCEKGLALGFVDEENPSVLVVEKVQNRKQLAFRLLETKVSAKGSASFSRVLARA